MDDDVVVVVDLTLLYEADENFMIMVFGNSINYFARLEKFLRKELICNINTEPNESLLKFNVSTF